MSPDRDRGVPGPPKSRPATVKLAVVVDGDSVGVFGVASGPRVLRTVLARTAHQAGPGPKIRLRLPAS